MLRLKGKGEQNYNTFELKTSLFWLEKSGTHACLQNAFLHLLAGLSNSVSGVFLWRRKLVAKPLSQGCIPSLPHTKKILKNSFCSYPFPFGVINRTCIAAGWIAILVECYSSDPWLSPTRLLGGDQWTIYLKDKRTNGWFILIPAGHRFPQAIMELLQPWRQQPLFLL